MFVTYLKQLRLLALRLSISYLAYFVCRIFFYVANRTYFPGVNAGRLFEDCFYGLRFDTFSIVISNSLFILLSLLPLKAFWHSTYQKILWWIFILFNPLFIAVNLIDVGYFPFIRKRASSDLFDQVGGQTDLGKLLPRFLIDFWWIVLCFILLVIVISYLYKRIKVIQPVFVKYTTREKILMWFLFALGAAISVLGVRGGFQRIPIDLVNAGSMTRPEEVPIVLNTPFSLIKSMNQKSLVEYEFYSASELKKRYDPVHHYKDSTFKKLNVVVLILESFSKEYTKLGKTISVTPFLDSLMDKGLNCTSGFANGSKSIEGIPAILSGLPSLMANPFINSMYANNDQTSLAYLLSKEGYECAFFHGGINGTMNFDDWASLAGYKYYFGKNEYNNDQDFDDYWGIWDEPFLQYSVKKMNKFKQPFHSAIFTLSSHHPYYVPAKYKNKFPKTHLENSECIAYADYSLRQFFKSAEKTNWYKNTLFVLVADHGGISEHPFYSNVVGNSSIPILFYKPGNSLKGIHAPVISQVDILPSILQQLGYNKPFFCFGESYADQNHGNDYFYANSNNYLFGDSTLYTFEMNKIRQVFNYHRDSLLYDNLTGKDPLKDSLKTLEYKAFIQTYNHTLIHNSGRLKN